MSAKGLMDMVNRFTPVIERDRDTRAPGGVNQQSQIHRMLSSLGGSL